MVAESGLSFDQRIPEQVHRSDFTAKVRKRRICVDDRNYAPVPFTTTEAVQAGDYEPSFPIDKDYWVARVTAEIGLRGQSGSATTEVRANIRVVSPNGADQAMIASDSRLRIPVGEHIDAISAETDEDWRRGFLNIDQLRRGQSMYLRVLQGSGGRLVVTVWLVPVRYPEE